MSRGHISDLVGVAGQRNGTSCKETVADCDPSHGDPSTLVICAIANPDT